MGASKRGRGARYTASPAKRSDLPKRQRVVRLAAETREAITIAEAEPDEAHLAEQARSLLDEHRALCDEYRVCRLLTCTHETTAGFCKFHRYLRKHELSDPLAGQILGVVCSLVQRRNDEGDEQ